MGEPSRQSVLLLVSGVYPLGCGGTAVTLAEARKRAGTSPGMWGTIYIILVLVLPEGASRPMWGTTVGLGVTPLVKGASPRMWGSLINSTQYTVPVQVYPLGCGGAGSPAVLRQRAFGVSPRMWGSPLLRHERRFGLGCIPVGAGEPALRQCCASGRSVYPLGCGGAPCFAMSAGLALGVSPWVRGLQNRPPAAVGSVR